jgi:hypothetical protein
VIQCVALYVNCASFGVSSCIIFAIAFGVTLCVIVHYLAFHCAPFCNSIWCFIVCHCALFGVSSCIILQ